MGALEWLVWTSLNFAAWAVNAAFLAFPIGFGAWLIVFNRRWAEDVLRQRRKLWRIGYSEFDVRLPRIAAVVLGVSFVLVGIVIVVQRLSR